MKFSKKSGRRPLLQRRLEEKGLLKTNTKATGATQVSVAGQRSHAPPPTAAAAAEGSLLLLRASKTKEKLLVTLRKNIYELKRTRKLPKISVLMCVNVNKIKHLVLEQPASFTVFTKGLKRFSIDQSG